jgi:radical SAM superfamily enzyme YgiQ (UPF0313 family)
MKTKDFVDIIKYTKQLFPKLERITIYGSAQYIVQKGLIDLKKIASAGLTRIHVGLESGDDVVLKLVRKGSTKDIQIEAGLLVKKAGIQLSEYIVLGLAGKQRSKEHIEETVDVLNTIDPDFIRIRTFLPKINTPILKEIESGAFQILSPHEVLEETYRLIEGLEVSSQVYSDHYTNYIQVNGKLPEDKDAMLQSIKKSLDRDETSFREVYIGAE